MGGWTPEQQEAYRLSGVEMDREYRARWDLQEARMLDRKRRGHRPAEIPAAVLLQVQKRSEMRSVGRYKEADEIRHRLRQDGWEIGDRGGDTAARRIPNF